MFLTFPSCELSDKVLPKLISCYLICLFFSQVRILTTFVTGPSLTTAGDETFFNNFEAQYRVDKIFGGPYKNVMV